MKHRQETPPALKSFCPEVPAELERIIAKAMARELKDRYQRVQDLLADIRQLKGQSGRLDPAAGGAVPAAVVSPPTLSPSGPSTRSARAQPRRRKPYRVGGVPLWIIILMIMGGLSAGYFFRQDVWSWVQSVYQSLTTISRSPRQLVDETEQILARLEEAEDHHAAGQALAQKGDWAQAVPELEKAVKFRDDHALYYHDLAVAYEHNGQWTQAAAAWQNLLRQDPGSLYAETARQKIAELAK
jgi:tetratricopeptide (TPR) repeat protein